MGTALLTPAQLAADPALTNLDQGLHPATELAEEVQKKKKKNTPDCSPPPTKVKEQLGQRLFRAVCF